MKRYEPLIKKAAASANIDEATLRAALETYDADAKLLDDNATLANQVVVLSQRVSALMDKCPVERAGEVHALLTQALEGLTSVNSIVSEVAQ